MGRHIKSERLERARPIVMPSTIIFCKINLQKLYARSRSLHLAHWNENQDYAEYIHKLWKTMLTHKSLKEEGLKLEEMLDSGDVVQLLSDMVMEYQIQLSNG